MPFSNIPEITEDEVYDFYNKPPKTKADVYEYLRTWFGKVDEKEVHIMEKNIIKF